MVVENEESPGLSGARNTGIGATTSEIVAFLDDDAKARPDWIEGLIDAYGAPDVAAVGGHAQPGWPDQVAPSWFPAEFGWVVGCSYTGQPSTLATVRNPIGCNMSFRREIFDLVGLFSSSIGRVGKRPVGCEETELCLRLKQALPQSRILYDPTLVVDHRVTLDRASPRYFFRRCWSEGISKAIVATLAGTEDGLSSERDYVTKVLPRGVARNLSDALRRRDASAVRRAAIIVGGLATTTAGYGYGLASSERWRAVQSQRHPARPRKVMTLDLDDPLPAVTSVRVGATPYAAVRILALKSGRPLGSVELPLAGMGMTAQEVAHGLALELDSVPDVAVEVEGVPLPRATVVVPSNVARADQLLRCIKSLSELDYPDFEVLVVDNRRGDPSGDWPVSRLRDLPRVKVLHEPRPGASAARNAGLRAATGQIVAFTDDDTVAHRGWLRALASRLAAGDVSCVTGLVAASELETPAQMWFEQYGGFGKGFRPMLHDLERPPARSPLFPYSAGMFGSGNNVAFDTESLRALGGFDEHLGPGTPTRAGEDLALFVATLWSGRRIAYEPSAIVHHTHRRSYAELRTQVHDYGMGLTGMLTSLVVNDPRHCLNILRRLPEGARLVMSPSSEKNSHRGPGYPRQLVFSS